MRKIPILAAALLVVIALPRVAGAQMQTYHHADCFFANNIAPCGPIATKTPLTLTGMTFGPATFVKPQPPRVGFIPRGAHGAHRFEPSVEWMAAPHTTVAFDCYMARVGDMSLDPKFVQAPPPMPLGHGGVALPAATPCSQLKSELSHVVIRR